MCCGWSWNASSLDTQPGSGTRADSNCVAGDLDYVARFYPDRVPIVAPKAALAAKAAPGSGSRNVSRRLQVGYAIADIDGQWLGVGVLILLHGTSARKQPTRRSTPANPLLAPA